MKQIKNKPLLLVGVITLAASMFAGCTEYADDPAEFTTENIVINYTDSVIDASISSGSRTRSVPESTEISSGVLTSKSGKKMYLSCTEAPWPVEKNVVTRGAKVTTVGISNMGVSASVYGSSSSYTSAGCGSYFYKESVASGTPTRFYWPTSNYKISFFGYYPYNNAAFTVQSAASATGAPTYSYTVPSTISSQQDIMTGQVVDRLGGSASPVNITLSHRCSALRFSVTNERSEVITINSISIEGVKYTGTLSGNTWTLGSSVNSSSTNPFTLTCNTSVAAGATVDITGTNNMFLMLPQTLPVGAKLLVTTDDDDFEANLTGTWVQSNSYSYSINITENDYIDLGLPSGLLWAKGNIVKDSQGNYSIGNETDYGAYYSWGNVVGHREGEGYNFNSSTYTGTTGAGLSVNIPVNNSYDAARANLGTPWRMPDNDEFLELKNNTDQEWVDINGVDGWKFMKKSDHSVFVFFPLSGYYNSTTILTRGSYGYCWSSSYYNGSIGYRMELKTSGVTATGASSRSNGFNIRAVCNIYYPGRNGAFVYTTDDKFYTADEWTVALSAGTVSNDDVVGVAVISGEHRFIIALSGTDKAIYSTPTACALTTITSSSAASQDFNGEANTSVMMQSYGSNNTYAAGYCYNTIFKNGKHGYLPAAGELNLAYQYKKQVDACMTACGGNSLSVANYHNTSSYRGPKSSYINIWGFLWSSGTLAENHINGTLLATRAFCSLE